MMLHRLAHLLHVHAVTRVDVALGVDRHVEVDLVVGEVRLRAPQVPVDARAAQHRPGLSECDRVVGREQPDPCVRSSQILLRVSIVS